MDTGADPCQDFFQYACGGWAARAKASASTAPVSRLGEQSERVASDVRTLLDEARSAPGTTQPRALLGRYFGACMDVDGLTAAGLAGVQDLLADTRRLAQRGDFTEALAALHKRAIWAGFSLRVERSATGDRTHQLVLDDGELGLPTRRHYLDGDKDMERVRRRYRDHIQRVFQLAGDSKKSARRAASRVLRLEIELARAASTAAARRRSEKWHTEMPRADLAKLARRIDWDGYLQALGRADIAQLFITSSEHLSNLNGLLSKSRSGSWADYLRWRVIDRVTPALSVAFAQARAEFVASLSGVAVPAVPRWRQCVGATDAALGWPLSRLYARARLSDSEQAAAASLVSALVDALTARMTGLDWLGADNQVRAVAKLKRLNVELGGPANWATFDLDTLAAGVADDAGMAGIWLAAHSWAVQRALALVGRPGDAAGTDWRTYAQRVDGYYDPRAHVLVASAGLLQAPLFAKDHSRAVQLGALAFSLGHELVHSVDDLGGRYDATGALAPWWTEADERAYRERAQCVSTAAYGPTPAPAKPLVRSHNLREDIADIGGVLVAWTALRNGDSTSGATQGSAEAPAVAGLDHRQQFFVAAAQAACEVEPGDDRAARRWGGRSRGRARINRAMAQVPGFAESFQCAAGTAMHPARRCAIW